MLRLVLPNGHQVRLVEQDIRRHEGRIGEKARIDVIRMLGGLILELGHAGQFPEHGIAHEDPPQLRMVVDMALDKDKALFRIDACRQQEGESLQGLLAQVRRVLADSQGMQVRHKIIAVVVFLELPPVADGPNIVPQREMPVGWIPLRIIFFLAGFSSTGAVCCSFVITSPPLRQVYFRFRSGRKGKKQKDILLYYTLFSRRMPVFPADSPARANLFYPACNFFESAYTIFNKMCYNGLSEMY